MASQILPIHLTQSQLTTYASQTRNQVRLYLVRWLLFQPSSSSLTTESLNMNSIPAISLFPKPKVNEKYLFPPNWSKPSPACLIDYSCNIFNSNISDLLCSYSFLFGLSVKKMSFAWSLLSLLNFRLNFFFIIPPQELHWLVLLLSYAWSTIYTLCLQPNSRYLSLSSYRSRVRFEWLGQSGS